MTPPHAADQHALAERIWSAQAASELADQYIMAENVPPAPGRAKGVKMCCCTLAQCRKPANVGGHRLSTFPQEQLHRVVRLLVPNDSTWRDKILANPSQYRVHTSHFRDEDKETRRGKLSLKPDALPVATIDIPAALPSEERINRVHPDRVRPIFADITGAAPDKPSQRQLFPEGSPKRRRLGMGRTVPPRNTGSRPGFKNPVTTPTSPSRSQAPFIPTPSVNGGNGDIF